MTLMDNNKFCVGWTRSFLAVVSTAVLFASGMVHACLLYTSDAADDN